MPGSMETPYPAPNASLLLMPVRGFMDHIANAMAKTGGKIFPIPGLVDDIAGRCPRPGYRRLPQRPFHLLDLPPEPTDRPLSADRVMPPMKMVLVMSERISHNWRPMSRVMVSLFLNDPVGFIIVGVAGIGTAGLQCLCRGPSGLRALQIATEESANEVPLCHARLNHGQKLCKDRVGHSARFAHILHFSGVLISRTPSRMGFPEINLIPRGGGNITQAGRAGRWS